MPMLDNGTAMSQLDDVLARLDRLIDWERRDRAGMRVDVQPARDLLVRLGHPERRFQAVHVAGTKGKGSVCALIDTGLRQAGRRTGRYASPHVQRVNERIVINGRDIDDKALIAVLASALDAHDAATRDGSAAQAASWFDVWTAAAFLAFAEHGVEWAAVECGIGGRLDSTNALDGAIAVLTNVDLEHTALLGDTHAAIARDKLGIVKPGRPLVTGVPPDSEAGAVVAEVVARQHSHVVHALPAAGSTLREANRTMANAVLSLIGAPPLTTQAAAAVQLPGRQEIFEPSAHSRGVRVVLDGAHVPSNLRAVLHDLGRDARFASSCVVVIGLARDKPQDAMLEALKPLHLAAVMATAYRHGVPPHEPAALAERAQALLGVACVAVEPPQDAYALALERASALGPMAWVLVTGSLHVVGAVREQVTPTRSP